jgi:Protein of unknown function (DUF4019)
VEQEAVCFTPLRNGGSHEAPHRHRSCHDPVRSSARVRPGRSDAHRCEGRVAGLACTRSLPNAPAGEYVVIQYETQFEHKANAIETVTPLREKNGSWKVSGYFISKVRRRRPMCR